MQTLMSRIEVDGRTLSARLRRDGLSAAIHLGVILAVVGAFHRSPKLAPYRLPGTHEGVRFLAYYSPGGPPQPESEVVVQKVPEKTAVAALHSAAAVPKPVEKQAPAAESGSGAAAQSGRGEGDITIALQTFFPYPKPNLSVLPHGTKGDVILNAVIDEQGKISDLTLVQGLGQPIDDVVIATVKQWSYTTGEEERGSGGE